MTLLDLMVLQRNDQLTGLVEDVTTSAPELDTFAAVARKGTFYEVVRRIAFPTAGFRKINAGVVPGRSAFKKEVKEMFYLDAIINMDEAIEEGDDQSVGSAWMNEATGVFRQALITVGAQVYYGTTADANGFAGLRTQISGQIGAGGTTSSTTAYLCWMDSQQGVRFDVGRGGAFNLRPPMRQQVTDSADSTKSYFAWVSNLSSYIGLNVISDKAVWGVAGITTHQTSSVYDQAMSDVNAGKLISNIPVMRRENLRWFMNRTAYFTLQASRTTVNVASGYSLQPADAAGRPAWSPRPTTCEGYPITLTDSLLNTESN